MRKHLALLIIFALPAVVLSEEGIDINIFGKSINLPSYCELHAKRSIVDKKLAISCTPPDYSSLAEIEVVSSAKCVESEILESYGPLGKNIIKNIHKNGAWYLEYTMYVPDLEKSLFTRVVRDKELCLRVTSSEQEQLDALSEKVWF